MTLGLGENITAMKSLSEVKMKLGQHDFSRC